MSSVFLSHNWKDKPWVRMLASRLTADGVLVWIDEAELNIGDSLIEKIAEGIEQMRFVAAVISNNSINSNWVQKELNLAMSKEVADRKVTVLPLLIEECSLPSSLRDKLYADFTDPNNFETEYQRLLRALGSHHTEKDSVTDLHRQKIQHPTQAESSPSSTDLRVIGVVKEKTRQDSEFSGLQDYFFKLSRRPPPEWDRFFDEARSFPRHSMWRRAWIEGDCVVVKCALDEIERHHLRDIEQDVATANENYDRAVRLHKEQERQRREQERKLIEERNSRLDNLDFDQK